MHFSTISDRRKKGTIDALLLFRELSATPVSTTTSTVPIQFDAAKIESFSVILVHYAIAGVVAGTAQWTIAVQVSATQNGIFTTIASQALLGDATKYECSFSGKDVAAKLPFARWMRLTATKIGGVGDLSYGAWITESSWTGVASVVVSTPPPPLPNQPPTVSITSPLNNSTATTGDTIPIIATASDSDGVIASVQFRVNGVNLNSPDTASPYTTNWIPSVLGIYTLTAVATDNQGSSTVSNPIVVTVSDPDPNPGSGAFSSAFSSAFS